MNGAQNKREYVFGLRAVISTTKVKWIPNKTEQMKKIEAFRAQFNELIYLSVDTKKYYSCEALVNSTLEVIILSFLF